MEKNREVKKARTIDSFTNKRLDTQGQPMFRQRFFNKGSSNPSSTFIKDRVNNPVLKEVMVKHLQFLGLIL